MYATMYVTWSKVGFPSFKTFKCRSLTRLGLKGVVAGVGRRPILPNSETTMDFVAKYMTNLQGNALNEPIFFPGLQPTLSFPPLDEPSVAARFNGYAAFMKRKRRMDGLHLDV